MSALTWPPQYGKTIEPNIGAGAHGGSFFRKRDVDHPIRKIEVWAAPSGDSIQGIRVTWRSSTSATIGTQGVEHPAAIDLAEDEKINEMSIWADTTYVHRVHIKTSSDQTLDAGRENGDKFDMNTASGFLAGFQAYADASKIYELGPYFLKPYVPGRTNNPLLGDSRGGNDYTALNLDRRVSKIQVWWGSGAEPKNSIDRELRKMKLTYEQADEKWFSGNAGPAPTMDKTYEFDLQARELVTKMTFWQREDGGGFRCLSGFEFETSKGNTFTIGTKTNKVYPVPDLGTGVLLGFEGKLGYCMDRATPVFAK
ncbi:hypothetical protein BDV25DRAFT_137559 [Aspergillus avenaceus]|uniref:Jacalin-type lectin domain-containing protein n=1 Tax=Aspergillus avenaceus TaxID=36643 RepID=A0A5N6U3C8_ASPAV|nr:hypothetical protein BDV25DRAFT_137559 [Aspergillus avenaceus]